VLTHSAKPSAGLGQAVGVWAVPTMWANPGSRGEGLNANRSIESMVKPAAVMVVVVSRFGSQPPATRRHSGMTASWARRSAGGGGAHVLVEAELATRAQDPCRFTQGLGRIGNGAQHQGHHHPVEDSVVGGQRTGLRVEHPDGDGGRHRRDLGVLAEGLVGCDGENLGDRRGVVREVQAVARTDLDHRTAQPGQQSVSMPGGTATLGLRTEPQVHPRETRMLQSLHILAHHVMHLFADGGSPECDEALAMT